MGENSYAMPVEPLSPELALVDPELGARARAMLPESMPAPRRPRPEASRRPSERRPRQLAPPRAAYPVWARMTAALWLVVLGILIGGTAIPHAQDSHESSRPPRTPTICEPAGGSDADPRPPGLGSPLRP